MGLIAGVTFPLLGASKEGSDYFQLREKKKKKGRHNDNSVLHQGGGRKVRHIPQMPLVCASCDPQGREGVSEGTLTLCGSSAAL